MAIYKQISERKYKLTAFNGYKPNGQKRTRSRTITIPDAVPKRGVEQFVRAEADAFEREFKYGYSEDANTTFEVFANRWLQRQTHYKASTLAAYRSSLRFCCEFIGGIKLRDIRPMTIEYLAEMLRRRERHGKRVSEKTVRKYILAVSVVLQDALRNDIVKYNAASRLRFAHLEKTRQFIPSIAEMERLMSCIAAEPLLYRLYFTLAVTTGLRRGELCALRWQDVKDGYLLISRSCGRVPGAGLVESDTKNHRERYVPLFIGAADLLYELLMKNCQTVRDGAGNVIRGGRPPSPDEHIFMDGGKLLHPDSFSRRLRRLLDRNGFPAEYHLHTLRHFFASYLLNNGVSNKVTADILGHADTGFLERTYGHSLPEFGEVAVKCIGGLFPAEMFTVESDCPDDLVYCEDDGDLGFSA